MLGLLRQLQFTRRVVEDVVFFREPFEEGLERCQSAQLRAKCQRCAVGLAVVEQVPLITLDDGLGDLARVGYAALRAPADEAA